MNWLQKIKAKLQKKRNNKAEFLEAYYKLVKKYNCDLKAGIVFADAKTGKLLNKETSDKILSKLQPILKRWGVQLKIIFTVDENRSSNQNS